MATGIYSGFFLIEMNIGSTNIRYVTLPYDVTINGVTYSADNAIAALDPPKLSDNADREAFKITFADPDLSFSSLADEMINARISILGGFFNTKGAYLTSSTGALIDVNKPLLNFTDTFRVQLKIWIY